MTLSKLRKIVNKGNNRNLRVVKVKKDRRCYYCNKTITAGSEALTVNKKLEPRYWVCGDCVHIISTYEEIKHEMENVSFGDEGHYMALQDCLIDFEKKLDTIDIGYSWFRRG